MNSFTCTIPKGLAEEIIPFIFYFEVQMQHILLSMKHSTKNCRAKTRVSADPLTDRS